MTLSNLNAAEIPLSGIHLIEASAGTGKTYNITRIYLRLLLEKELKVEQILLMTFTKDATQELRGRIDAFIREALANWKTLCVEDVYFSQINARVPFEKIEFLLKRALLFLDEAAIYTIHGFCQRAITEHAFSSGLPFNVNLATSTRELALEACQDWYRQLAKQNEDEFSLVARFWSQPDAFLTSFARAIEKNSQLNTLEPHTLVVNFVTLCQQAKEKLTLNDALIQSSLLTHKNSDEQDKRREELARLYEWLTPLMACQDHNALLDTLTSPIPDYLLNGNRHPKAFKAELADILAPCKSIKTECGTVLKNINKSLAYQVVRDGIYHIREQIRLKKRQQNSVDFDDLIHTLADCLSSEGATNDVHDVPDGRNHLSAYLLKQYPVALVDEFQDTDPLQYSILQSIYFSPEAKLNHAALYLIGDPKQAIYGFRGGDIFAYLTARTHCQYHWLMDTNYRSTPNMVNAYNELFSSHDGQAEDAVFGYGIPYNRVVAGKQGADINHDDTAIKSHALQLVAFNNTSDKRLSLQYACPIMATWCANEIVRLMNEESIKPQDIAILVRDSGEAKYIQTALQAANLASVFLSDRANLFHSLQAKQLLALLKSILSPLNERVFFVGLTSGLLGYDAVKLYQLQQDELAFQTLKYQFIEYKKLWQQQGFIAMAIPLMHQHFQLPALNKDRALTNLLHLFEILQASSQRFLQPEELLHWFEQQCQLENINSELEAELRLESDGNLIRIITQHGSKGLEYPIVFIPFSTKHKNPLKFGNQNISYLEYHNQHNQLVLSLDGDETAKASMASEAYAESIRLLYVAVTRAEQRCYLLCAPFDDYAASPLGQTLQWQKSTDMIMGLQQLVDKSPETIELQQIDLDLVSDSEVYVVKASNFNTALNEMKSTKFCGNIERDWWLSSFSALTRNLRHVGVSNPDRDIDMDNNDNRGVLSHDLLRFILTKGAHSGNLLHDILEKTDFSNAQWHTSIKWPLVKYGELPASFTETDLIAWLKDIIDTPLVHSDTDKSDFCLHHLSSLKTLRESEFYYPMKQANMGELSNLLSDHRNSDLLKDKPLYKPVPVELPYYHQLKGMMHGFIDLVFEHQGKYYVCDYKSSHLGDHFDDYHVGALRSHIENNYYDLQYLIYCLAVHRYLKNNLPDYDPQQHFGGIYYLYLRGMTNEEKHHGKGVYYRPINSKTLNELDRLFAEQDVQGEGQ